MKELYTISTITKFKKVYHKHSKVLDEYKKMEGKKSKYFAKIEKVDLDDKSMILEKLDTSPKIKQDLKQRFESLFDVKLDGLTIIEEGIESKYVQDRLNKIPKGEREKAIELVNFIQNAETEGRKLGISIDDIHEGNIGVDSKGNYKMFDMIKQ